MPQRGNTPKPALKSTTAKNTPVVDLSEIDAKVTYEIALTKKTGDFEFIKLTAGVEVPIGITDAQLDEIDKKLVIVRDRIIHRLEKDLESIDL